MSVTIVNRGQKKKSNQISWIGFIPSHWEIKRGKSIFKRMKRPAREQDTTITAFRDGQVTLRSNRRTAGFTESIQEIGYQGIRKNDLVIHAMDGFAGAIGVSDSDGKGSPVYSVCVPRFDNTNTYYFAHLLREMARCGYINSLAKGIRERSTDFRFVDFATQNYCVPPLSEQNAIVAFLDEKLTKIDQFIVNKKREIELLNEYKSSLIAQVVTKGLDQNVEMKNNSKVEWVGNIPKHWNIEIFKCKFRMSKKRVKDDPSADQLLSVSGYRGIEKKDVSSNEGQMPSDDISQYRLVRPGQLVVNTMWLNYAGLGVSNLTGFVSPAYRAYDINKSLNPRYIHYLMRSALYVQKYSSLLYGIRPNSLQVKPYDFERIEILIPPSPEQNKIVEYLDDKCSRIEKLISFVEQSIEKMNEYRQSLIADAVTGKLDIPHTT